MKPSETNVAGHRRNRETAPLKGAVAGFVVRPPVDCGGPLGRAHSRLAFDLIQALDRIGEVTSRPLRFSTSTSIPAPRGWLDRGPGGRRKFEINPTKNCAPTNAFGSFDSSV
jgi:hypothetical protein